MKAVLCPVCNGSGEAGDWLKGLPLTTKSICWGCGGKGWVEVGNADDRLKPIDNTTYNQPPNYNRCPDCGGDRNSPALTGCRKGSHYGTYCGIQQKVIQNCNGGTMTIGELLKIIKEYPEEWEISYTAYTSYLALYLGDEEIVVVIPHPNNNQGSCYEDNTLQSS